MTINTDFLKEWEEHFSKTYDELKTFFLEKVEKLKKEGLNEEEAIEEARSLLYIECKGEMNSPAVKFVGIIFGSTEPFDWTKNYREFALKQYKETGDAAIGKYVTIDKETKTVKPLWYSSKDEAKRTQVLEPTFSKMVFGYGIKITDYADIQYIQDKIKNELKDEKTYSSKNIKAYKTMKPDQLTTELANKWKSFRWFDLSVGFEYANDKSEKFVKIPDDKECFKCFEFRALDKTNNEPTYVLNCSSTTEFVKSELITIDLKTIENLLKSSPRFIEISKLEAPFNNATNFALSGDKKEKRTTKDIYITYGSVSSDIIDSKYSDMLFLDHMSLGFDPTKKVPLYMPKGSVDFGKNTKIYVIGKLSQKLDTTKQPAKWSYPAVGVSSFVIIKKTEMVKKEDVKDKMKEENKGVQTDKKKTDTKTKEEDNLPDENADNWSGGI